MQDSNPRLRLRRPEGYPDYPNCPKSPKSHPFLNHTLAFIQMLSMLRGIMSDNSPCVRKGCSMCCRETVMPITATEASKLSRRTGLSEEQFCSVDETGVRRLLNNQETKACVFLATTSSLPTAPGVCSVYDSRPLGCRMYPVILDNDDSAILDDLCPHKSEFDIPSEEDAHRLLNFESKL